jgi:hypothetical protein
MLKWIVHVKPNVPALERVSSPVVVSTVVTGFPESPPFSPIGCDAKSAGAATPSDVNFTFWPTFTFMQRSGLLKSDVSQVMTRVASVAVLSTNVEQLLTPASTVPPDDPPEEPPEEPPDEEPPDDDPPPSPDVAPEDDDELVVDESEHAIKKTKQPMPRPSKEANRMRQA